MPLGYYEKLITNNPEYDIIPNTKVKGMTLRVATLAELYALDHKSKQLAEKITHVYVDAASATYLLVDITQIANSAGWLNTNSSTITIDPTPTSGSTNAVSSGGVFTSLSNKQPLEDQRLSVANDVTFKSVKVGTTNTSQIIPTTLTANHTATLQDASGILAFLSDISSAIAALSAVYQQKENQLLSTSNNVEFNQTTTYLILLSNTDGFSAIIDSSNLTDNQTFTLPDTSGTFALLSDIPSGSFQPLENQRLSTTNSPTWVSITTTSDIIVAGLPLGLGSNNNPTNLRMGLNTLSSNTSGSGNVALGSNALYHNNSGASNLAIGANAMYAATTGSSNTALGGGALFFLTTGSANTAVGPNTLAAMTTGSSNTAIGNSALGSATTGDNNVSIGQTSGFSSLITLSTLNNCTFIGTDSTSTTNSITNSTAVGYQSKVTASNQMSFGNTSVTLNSFNGKVITTGKMESTGFIKTGGTGDQFLMADGTVLTVGTETQVMTVFEGVPQWVDPNSLGTTLHGIQTPTTGSTVSIINSTYNIINPSATLAALTLQLPGSPSNGDTLEIKFIKAVTSITYTNGTVAAPIITASVGTLVKLVYHTATTTWY